MKLKRLSGRRPSGYTTFGGAWAQGTVLPGSGFTLKSGAQHYPVQSRVTATWPDGSVKWTAHTAKSDALPETVELLPAPTENADSALTVTQSEGCYVVKTDSLSVEIPLSGPALFRNLCLLGEQRVEAAAPVLLLESRTDAPNGQTICRTEYSGTVESVTIEERGPICAVFAIRGCHRTKSGAGKWPFVLRLRVGAASNKLDFTHTFMVDNEGTDEFLAGLGVRFAVPLAGDSWNHHLQFGVDHGVFHEPAILLNCWRPHLPSELYTDQISGKAVTPTGETLDLVRKAAKDLPVWNEFELCQDATTHFSIRKGTGKAGCCLIDCLHGERAEGTMALSGQTGGIALGLRDFWQKYPAGYTVAGLSGSSAAATLWLWPPSTQAMDFRHYTDRGYDQTCYEGFPEVRATPNGIANTSEFSLLPFVGTTLTPGELTEFGRSVQKPAVYFGEPAYYHELGVFGYWSLPRRDTPMQQYLEDQLSRAAAWYIQEVDVRGWYGRFNYGDFRHGYDPVRHCWKYDTGGYAWQNTELVPTLWLWLAFMRSGEEALFTLAEAMTRHCSEVDLYHLGPYQGLGSRHNVRHWGDACKEARVAMAAHHRVFYYLTGDYRLGDIFSEVLPADQSLANLDPLRYFYKKDEMVYPTHARSGPDWSSLCSNWMTEWERFGSNTAKARIETGVADILATPLKLTSGPDFEFDPKTGHLRYIGVNAAGGSHLQICMGSVEVWMELGELLQNEDWKEALAAHGRFYFLSPEEKTKESGGLIGTREFSFPFMAAALGAYSAFRRDDKALATTVWKELLHALFDATHPDGFATEIRSDVANHAALQEIPWISTNFTSQWCLNTIVTLDLIGQALPSTLPEAFSLMEDMPETWLHRA